MALFIVLGAQTPGWNGSPQGSEKVPLPFENQGAQCEVAWKMPVWRWVNGIAHSTIIERASESLWETTGEALLKCESVLECREPCGSQVSAHVIVQTAS